MSRVAVDPRAEALLAPVRAALDEGVSRLSEAPPLRVEVGPVAGFCALTGDRLVLAEALEGPGVSHPDEPAVLGLDRWRRALACVLEAVATRGLQARHGPAAADWRWVGRAVDLADRAVPELGLALPDLAIAISTGDLGAHPRAGVAAIRAMAPSAGVPGEIDAEAWLAVATRALDPERSALPVPVPRVPDRDVPLRLGPWRWQPLAIPAHPRGGLITVDGAGAVREPWAPARRVHKTLAVSLAAGCALGTAPGGPVGAWEVRTASGFGQVFGVRGVSFELRGSGALDVVLADAFVGPVHALPLAERVGTSGAASGTWQVAGDHALRIDRLDASRLTMHGRRGPKIRVPASAVGLSQWLLGMQEGVWRWQLEGDRLVLRGPLMGGDVEVRLERA